MIQATASTANLVTDAAEPATRAELTRALEAALFLGLEPVEPAKVARTWPRWRNTEVRSVLLQLAARYRRQHRPYTVRESETGFVLYLDEHWQDRILAVLHPEKPASLPKPVVDVLSVVLYQQPVTREQIEALTQSDPRPALRQLQRRDLVAANAEAPAADDEPAGETTYTTTARCLQILGLASLEDLPRETR